MESATRPVVLGYVRAGAAEGIESLRAAIVRKAAESDLTLHELYIEPNRRSNFRFHELLGALDLYKLTTDQPIVVILGETTDMGVTVWAQRAARRRLENLDVRIEIA